MKNTVRTTIIKNSLIAPHDRILCAISGGADSVALLHCLFTLRDEIGFTLSAAHFNHGIRGDAADADEEFVKRFCEKLGIELICGSANVPEYADRNGYTLEQAGRILRYDFFNTITCDKIATAHHMDDQAESIMLHITRGTGTSGLCGMRYSRGKLIRPLLDVRRKDIELYVKQNDLQFCTDLTNFIEDGTRNKLRLSIIPQITEKINPKFTEALCSMSKIVQADEDFLMCVAEKELEKLRLDDGYVRGKILNLDMPIRRRVLRLAMIRAGALTDIEQKHVELVEGLLSGRTGAYLELPHIVAFNSYEKICFSNKEKYVTMMKKAEYRINFREGDIITPQGTLSVERVSGHSFESVENTAFIDADKLPSGVIIRQRLPGDRISPMGSSGSKKLKDFFIDKKIDRDKRNMPLICHENDVMCVVGVTVDRKLKVTPETRQMLKITYFAEGNK